MNEYDISEEDAWASATAAQEAGKATEEELKKKIKVEPTWYCVHCQRPTPKRVTMVYDGARVCQDTACVKFVMFEDGYATLNTGLPPVQGKVCGRCGKEE